MEPRLDDSLAKKYRPRGADSCGTIYGLGIIGALFFYIPRADGILAGLFGVLKALVWPAIVVYKTLEALSF